jgi:hypothetical protein
MRKTAEGVGGKGGGHHCSVKRSICLDQDPRVISSQKRGSSSTLAPASQILMNQGGGGG